MIFLSDNEMDRYRQEVEHAARRGAEAEAEHDAAIHDETVERQEAEVAAEAETQAEEAWENQGGGYEGEGE